MLPQRNISHGQKDLPGTLRTGSSLGLKHRTVQYIGHTVAQGVQPQNTGAYYSLGRKMVNNSSKNLILREFIGFLQWTHDHRTDTNRQENKHSATCTSNKMKSEKKSLVGYS